MSNRPARYGLPPNSLTASMEIYNPDTNGREVVPYQQPTQQRRTDNHAQVYTGPSAYLRDPRGYSRQIKQQRADEYHQRKSYQQPPIQSTVSWPAALVRIAEAFAGVGSLAEE